MKLRMLGLLLFPPLSALLGGCGMGAATPEEAAHASCGSPQSIVDFKILTRREIPEGTLVFSTCHTRAQGQFPEFHSYGLILVERGNFGWQTLQTIQIGMEPQPDPAEVITASTGQIQDNVVITYGLVLSDKVAELEVHFVGGGTQVKPPQNGMYDFIYRLPQTACRIVAYDERGAALVSLPVGAIEWAGDCDP